MNVWKRCEGEQHFKRLSLTPWRVVEYQHHSSTRTLVDTVEEHQILEDLIEGSKPIIDSNIKEMIHYLLYTPFRYPPLKYGSRFGHRFEPSLWYGSLALDTAFSEVAFYRLLFLQDTDADLGYIKVNLTAFNVKVLNDKSVELNALPFDKFRNQISSPSVYRESQALGMAMRAAAVELFTYYSARDSDEGINVGVFTPIVFKECKPNVGQTWECLADQSGVEFMRITTNKIFRKVYPRKQFIVDGKFPLIVS